MSQRAALTPEQARVLEHLERDPTAGHSAEELHKHLGIGVHPAMFALQELERHGYARRDLECFGHTDETAHYLATRRGM
jgi:DNA-binding IclR family transcriptional regulator